jgi:hypothetical protein
VASKKGKKEKEKEKEKESLYEQIELYNLWPS